MPIQILTGYRELLICHVHPDDLSAGANHLAQQESISACPTPQIKHGATFRRYWQRRPVLGLGLGAWSNEPPSVRAPHGARRANTRDLGRYLEAVEDGRSALGELDTLDENKARGEAMFLGLVGGVVGGIFGLLLTFAYTFFTYGWKLFAASFNFEIVIEQMGIAMALSMVLCVVSAIYPVYFAARLQPADAMRYEV